jgi:hypothetical protein
MVAFIGTVAAVLLALAVILHWMDRKKVPSKEHLRRGTGNAMLVLQEFVEPSIEYVVQAKNVEQKEEEDDDGLGEDEHEAICSDLAEALSQTPIDLDEVRRHLAAAARSGLDWSALFERAVHLELQERPFRAPLIPPPWRVAPRQ